MGKDIINIMHFPIPSSNDAQQFSKSIEGINIITQETAKILQEIVASAEIFHKLID